MAVQTTKTNLEQLEKVKTGIKGFDEITGGGLPKGRTTLVCGGPGCGKTLLASEFLVNGALDYGEPGVFMAFEETAEELARNVASLGIPLEKMVASKQLFVDFVYIERSEIEEAGVYDLEGFFIRLGDAIDSIGAKRVVLDTVEVLFSGFSNEAVLRSELRRLFRWLKDRGVTTIVTGEAGAGGLTRYGIEEYVSDCVIVLDHRMSNQIATRVLRVVKYRGSAHWNNEYPFLIDDRGIWVMPITSLGLDYQVSTQRICSGIPSLDAMLDGEGFYRGSSILASGTSGTGKSSLAAFLVDAACRRGERCLYFSFEEASSQIIRNMRSIGLDLEQWVSAGLLKIRAMRPSMHSLEMHLLMMQNLIDEFRPSVTVVDPINNLASIATLTEMNSMLVRLIDHLKTKQVTSLFTSLTGGGEAEVSTDTGISSLMDTWILVTNLERNGERSRGLYVLKARGMAHSNQVREFIISDKGLDLIDVYVGSEGILTGTARVGQEARDRAEAQQRQWELERKKRELERKRKTLEDQIESLQAELSTEEEDFNRLLSQDELSRQTTLDTTSAIRRSRKSGAPKGSADEKSGVEEEK